ncbi:putative RNA methyltransferase [Nonomuraea lactucae]|uniref:putative RNA methyltransferase n=1 Tax=Nonomuraea lactucae TaxID=2249762 RepID=UPI000DE1F7E9|nr:methyltransferase domain-containing protein [Nonomuraea lactucae]
MLADIIEYLACPVCRESMSLARGAVRCGQGHAFDVAKQGYVSLLMGSQVPGTADSADMVAARAGFLGAGHFAPLADTVAELVAELVAARVRGGHRTRANVIRGERFSERPDGGAGRAYGGPWSGHDAEPAGQDADLAARPVIVDAGAGTGHYLATVLEAVDRGIGVAFDVSKHAVRRAARAHPRVGAFVADVWRPLPLRSGVADVVMDVFAPRNGPEFRRVLRPGGAVVVVTPAEAHLSPLVRELGLLSVDEDKDRRVARSMEGFAETERRTVEFDMELSRGDVAEVVRMGPSAWHTDPAELDERISSYISRRAENREKVVTRAAFHLSIFEAEPRTRAVA